MVDIEVIKEDAGTNGFRIMPLCPFVKARYRKNPEWSDVML